MPRYFFHLNNGSMRSDLTGTELPNDEAAREQATIASTRMIRELGDKFWTGQEWRMLVYAGTDHIFTLNFTGKVFDRRR